MKFGSAKEIRLIFKDMPWNKEHYAYRLKRTIGKKIAMFLAGKEISNEDLGRSLGDFFYKILEEILPKNTEVSLWSPIGMDLSGKMIPRYLKQILNEEDWFIVEEEMYKRIDELDTTSMVDLVI